MNAIEPCRLSSGYSRSVNSGLTDDHVVFKVCLSCGFDTLTYLNRPRNRGPSFRCLECEAYNFVVACSECMYESSADCPLTQLLGRKHGIHETDNGDDKVRRRPRKCSWESEEKGEAEADREGGSPPAGEGEFGGTAEQSPARESVEDQISEKPKDSPCFQCNQSLCRTCEPGYMKIIIDMKEFSKTFADEMCLCTLCDHGLCLGSRLVALLRCMGCGHDECNGCSRQVEEMGEEWCVCCSCGRGNDEFAGEPHRNVGAEIVGPRYQDDLQASQT